MNQPKKNIDAMTTGRVMMFFIEVASTFFTRDAPVSSTRNPAWMRIINAIDTH